MLYSQDSGKNKLHMLTLCFTKDQRSILRFLWQRNRDIRNHLKIMKCVYIYLVVFHLQIAAIMLWNELWKIFGPDAARTLRQNSYVDDMLKSYRWVSGAVDPTDKKDLQDCRIQLDKVRKPQDWSNEINSRETLQKITSKNVRVEKYKKKDHYVCYGRLKQIQLDSKYPWRISQQQRQVWYANEVQCMIHLVWHHHLL